MVYDYALKFKIQHKRNGGYIQAASCDGRFLCSSNLHPCHFNRLGLRNFDFKRRVIRRLFTLRDFGSPAFLGTLGFLWTRFLFFLFFLACRLFFLCFIAGVIRLGFLSFPALVRPEVKNSCIWFLLPMEEKVLYQRFLKDITAMGFLPPRLELPFTVLIN